MPNRKSKSSSYKYDKQRDIDIDDFSKNTGEPKQINDIESLSPNEKQLMEDVAILTTREGRSGTYVQIDQEAIFYDMMLTVPGLTIKSIDEAMTQFAWLKNYIWSLVPPEKDKFTVQAKKNPHKGYFIRAEENAKILDPVQSCLMIKSSQIQQNVHNIVITEPSSELHVVTGCTTPSHLERSLHIGVSEFFVKKNSKLTFTMIHRWSEASVVRPRTVVHLEEGAEFVSNYVILNPVADLQTFPTIRLTGPESHASVYSTVYGTKDSHYDIGSRLELLAPNTAGEVVSHSVADDTSTIIARGDSFATCPDTRAHLECNGLILGEHATMKAIPQLTSEGKGAALSHEATVGKIEQEQLIYLMSKGLSDEEANALIVRGFMGISPPGLPPVLQKAIDDAITTALKGF